MDKALSDDVLRPEPGHDAVSRDDAVLLLTLAARLYGSRGEPLAWIAVLRACRDLLGCASALDLPSDVRLNRPDDLEALAGRVTHCADYGSGGCGESPEDAVRRGRCAALAAHMHEAAIAQRRKLQAAVFDQLPPTWILDREGYVLVENVPARSVIAAGDALSLGNGRLLPGAPGAGEKLRRTLRDLVEEVRFAWPVADGSEASLLLRPLAADRSVAAMLPGGPLTIARMAQEMAAALALTARQAELAAYLLAGHDLTDAARKMAISRNTANEHLVALLRRTGTSDRKELLFLLLGTVRH